MKPKKIDDVMKILRSNMLFQKISAIRKGKPVCAEKNRSPVKVKKFISRYSTSIGIWCNDGAVCVSMIKNARTTINTLRLFSTKGKIRGRKAQSSPTKTKKINNP